MNLNPITALSDQLQKLINEHGSAAILRDHLAMFKDQVVILEKKAALLESENSVLKAENEKLKSEAQELKKDNGELRSKIKEYENTSQNNLPGNEVNILKFLFKQNANARSRADQITHSIKTDLQATEFYLGELKIKKLIQDHHIVGSNFTGSPSYTYWTLTHEGRRYLIEHKLT